MLTQDVKVSQRDLSQLMQGPVVTSDRGRSFERFGSTSNFIPAMDVCGSTIVVPGCEGFRYGGTNGPARFFPLGLVVAFPDLSLFRKLFVQHLHGVSGDAGEESRGHRVGLDAAFEEAKDLTSSAINGGAHPFGHAVFGRLDMPGLQEGGEAGEQVGSFLELSSGK